MDTILVAGSIIVGVFATGIIVSKFMRKNGHQDIPKWLMGGLASLILIPAFFWVGSRFFHVRITFVTLLALTLGLGILSLLQKE